MKLTRIQALTLAGIVTVGTCATAVTTAWGGQADTAVPATAVPRLPAPMDGPAEAAGKSHFTHATRLSKPCPIFDNYPKSGVPQRSWSKAQGQRVGVRYAYKGQVLVLDYAKPKDPSWGFIDRACLNDPFPRTRGDRGARVRQDLRAIGGDNRLTNVPISAAHQGLRKRKLIHLGSNGSLRSAPRAFVIGNLRGPGGGATGDSFYITRSSCGQHGPQSWILGYAPAAGRWGYVEAMHLPACR